MLQFSVCLGLSFWLLFPLSTLFAQASSMLIDPFHSAANEAVQFDIPTQTYTVRAGLTGKGVSKSVTGNFILSVEIPQPPVGASTQAGISVQFNSSDTEFELFAALEARGKVGLYRNATSGQAMIELGSGPKRHYRIIQVERRDQYLICRAAVAGEPLQELMRREWADLPRSLHVGICAKDSSEKPEVVQFQHLRLDCLPPASDGPSEAGTYEGSRLEILDTYSGQRQIIHTDTIRFEAPNWLPDGKSLLFNQAGKLYQLAITGGSPTLLDTDFADRNNNDHGISFDGKQLAISHHREGMPGHGSTIYVLPLSGGKPKLVTPLTPSYWHGWAPDHAHVLYVAQRGADPGYHIFQANIHTQEEAQLSNFQGSHVDGPEYDPAGEWIYYNGNQTGSMQLWRMRPDGTEHEQLTFDEWNNWFPHISPDGKWVAFLSFPPTIPVDGHPANKRVMLRLMPTDGGAPKVIAWLFGGQGSINVPSWSPDSRHLAFVSYFGEWPQD